MSIAKPFTFVANTYAKASEVNADFDTVYSQVNTNISNIAQNAADIDNLENNKANINGSTAQRFAVADPVNNADAVNKQTLNKSIANSKGYINGLRIDKDNNNTILVYSGSCYDSTGSVVLSLSSNVIKQNATQAANATYHVYIIGNDTGSSIDIMISGSSTTPSLPSGYTKYRAIGKYTTDAYSNIKYIYPYSNSGTYSMPDTKAVVIETYHSGNSWYRVWSDGFCEQGGKYLGTAASTTVNLLKTFTDTNYSVLTTLHMQDTGPYGMVVNTLTTSSFKVWETNMNLGTGYWWRAEGYVSV